MPQYPPPSPSPGWGAPDPGRIPLRPLRLGEMLGGGLGLVFRYLAVLGPVAVLLAAISVAVELGVLSGTGALESFASGQWLTDWQQGLSESRFDTLPGGFYLGVGIGSLLSIINVLVLSGVAAACVGVDTVSRQHDGAAAWRRVTPMLGRLLLTAALLGALVMVGSVLFIVPGLIAFAAWGLAGPVAVMEPGSAPLSRSARLTRGHRGSLLGAVVLIVLITAVIDAVIGSLAVPIVEAFGAVLSDVAALVITDAVGAVLAAITSSWIGAVIALQYLDIRIRDENLAAALRASAPAEQ